MPQDDVARWMREEHTKVEKLANRLREWVAVIPHTGLAGWIEETRARFDPLRAHLIKHMALEENEGYLLSVSEQRPTLARNVDRLRHEHQEFCRLMDGIHRDLAELAPGDALIARDCCHRISNFLGYVEHHEEAENLLVTFVFTHDIGTKD